jgi:hypothetical protein
MKLHGNQVERADPGAFFPIQRVEGSAFHHSS